MRQLRCRSGTRRDAAHVCDHPFMITRQPLATLGLAVLVSGCRSGDAASIDEAGAETSGQTDSDTGGDGSGGSEQGEGDDGDPPPEDVALPLPEPTCDDPFVEACALGNVDVWLACDNVAIDLDPELSEVGAPFPAGDAMTGHAMGSGLEETGYVGAFDPDGESWLPTWVALGEDLELPSMPDECAEPWNTDKVTLHDEDVAGDATWSCDTVHVLDGVRVVEGGTLTIEPGTTVRGMAGSALVILDSGRIDAVGTDDAPILFTSDAIADVSAEVGDWGGIVLIGLAPVNVASADPWPSWFPPRYGGDDPTHDCGRLRHVRVEWSGNEVYPGHELNGISLYACGSQTELDHVQVRQTLDDGIEWFGGMTKAHHLVIVGAQDDALDFDQGVTGSLQWLLTIQAELEGDNAAELSNRGDDVLAEPRTDVTIANATFIGAEPGGEHAAGIQLRQGGRL